MHGCAGLRHALTAHGADPNIRYDLYDYPHIYSITPLHAVVKYAARIADIWDMNIDAAAMARALLDAGADPDARCEIVASCDAPKAPVPYDGPPYGATAAMMLAAPRGDVAGGKATGPVSLAMLRELLQRGAAVDARDGGGRTLREQELLTPQARALLDELAA
jgi:hypothetical protein